VGRPQCREQYYVRYFGKSPVSIKPRCEKYAAGGRRRSSGCENEGGYVHG